MILKTRILYGIAINDANYQTQKSSRASGKLEILWTCPFYSRWYAMLERCYSKRFQLARGNYLGCRVCREWLTFSNFRAWMERQDWQGKHLDKDLFSGKDKVYSPDTCAFVEPGLNTFLASFSRNTSKGLMGAYKIKDNGRYYARCKNPITGKNEHLGAYGSEIEAHDAWRRCKVNQCLAYARRQDDARVRQALLNLSMRI